MFYINQLILSSFLSGLIFIIAALITLKYPPKKINMFYGYRTSGSMKNQKTWVFAQKYSAYQFIISGSFLMLISCLGLLIPLTAKTKLFIGLPLIFIAILYSFLKTEYAIKKQFN